MLTSSATALSYGLGAALFAVLTALLLTAWRGHLQGGLLVAASAKPLNARATWANTRQFLFVLMGYLLQLVSCSAVIGHSVEAWLNPKRRSSRRIKPTKTTRMARARLRFGVC